MRRMRFDVTAQQTGIVFQLPASRGKGIADADVDVFVVRMRFKLLLLFFRAFAHHGGMQGRLMFYHNLRTRDGEVNGDVKIAPLLLVVMRSLHHDMPPDNAWEVTFKGGALPIDAGFDCLGGIHVTEGDLNWEWHCEEGCEVSIFREKWIKQARWGIETDEPG